MGRNRIYTEEENLARKHQRNKEWYKTIIGRASGLVNSYNQNDKKYGRGKGDITAKWIVENIFTKPCVHCGETDWHKLGCNRLDNSKPHTKDNVEPCCRKCNLDIQHEELSKPIQQIDPRTREIVRIWKNANECAKNGFTQQNINACCNGKRIIHKGYIWKYLNDSY